MAASRLPSVSRLGLRARRGGACVKSRAPTAKGQSSAPWRRHVATAATTTGTADISSGTVGQHAPPRLSVAPMMDWTDVHYRFLARLISRHSWLYTEMVVDNTLVYNEEALDRYLWLPPNPGAQVLQLGGSNPNTLARAVELARDYDYAEINLNCGCPSDRVAGAGCFGARLMLDPGAVAAAVAAISGAAVEGGAEATVKCRIGADDMDTYDELCAFVEHVASRGGCKHFIVHARKCLLSGLSTTENRTVPPLRREWVWALARDFPELQFTLNGQVQSAHEAAELLDSPPPHGGGRLAGVMIGRAAYERPWLTLGPADVEVYGEVAGPATSRRQVLEDYAAYAGSIQGTFGSGRNGVAHPKVRTLAKPLLGLFHAEKGGKVWRREVDTALRDATSVAELLERTLPVIPDEVLDAPPPTGETHPWAVAKELPELPEQGAEGLLRNRASHRPQPVA